MNIEQTTDEKILRACAKLMSKSEPWLTLKRNFKNCLEAVQVDNKEIYVASDSSSLLGFAVLQMTGTFKGYIQTICVSPHLRGKGIGTSLLTFCEDIIFQVSPNVFMCVSSFYTKAAKLYYKTGYEKIGELKSFIVHGHSEILLRKTIGPLSGFRSDKTPAYNN